VRGMVKNRRLARSVSDMGFYEFRWQLEYKAGMHGSSVIAASSSASSCGENGPGAVHQYNLKPLSLKQEVGFVSV